MLLRFCFFLLCQLIGGALGWWPTRLAPAGGTALMAGWVLLALSALRR